MSAPPVAAVALSCVLILTPPNRIEYEERKAHLGPAVWSALFVLTERGGRVPLPDFCRAVWEVEAVAARSVRTLCLRVNEALAGLGCPARCRADAGAVILSG